MLKQNLVRYFLFGLLGMIGSAVPAAAQGVIIPKPCPVRHCPRPIPRPVSLPTALPVKSIKLDVKIKGLVATTRVEQVFHNDTAYTLEGAYLFPIPETASVAGFAVWENGKRLSGEVRTREQARRIYDQIVRQKRDPGLLEYAGKELLQASIFPILPNSDKKIELIYTQILSADSGTVGFHYPLGTGRIIRRRHWRPFREQSGTIRTEQKYGTVAGRVEISGTAEDLRNIYSPSHKIETVRKSDHKKVAVSFETNTNDSDFYLFYGISDRDFGLSLITYREPAKPGYFLLSISPKDNVTEREIVDKDIVFVIDTSGSMADEGKIDKARAALLFGIRNLRDTDRFNVISFAGEERLLEEKPILADRRGRTRGVEFVEKLRPTGGTNINDALLAGLRQFDRSDRAKMMVFLTDGRPTVGEDEIEKILANAAKIPVATLRIFPFGVGYDVNTRLLDKLATENGGLAEYVAPKEDLEIKVSNFFTKVGSPVLADVDLGFGGVSTNLVYPKDQKVLFRGTQLIMIGRYEDERDITNAQLTLTGKTGRQKREFEYFNLKFPLRADENDFLPRLWASRRVGWLIEQIRLNGENAEIKKEIIELGTRYGIVTPYTSYLAADGTRHNLLPSDAGRGDLLKMGAADSLLQAETGREAVGLSRRQNAMQSNSTVLSGGDGSAGTAQIFVPDTVKNKYVGTKNFVRVADVWIDSEYYANRDLAEKTLKFASREYFSILDLEKELAKFFALGEEVVVVWKNKIYRVTR